MAVIVRNSRRAIVLGAVVLALVLGAQPVAAARILKDTGTQGYYELYDEMGGPRGANCLYKQGTYELGAISVRPPLMHGNYATKTKVQWRFKIRRQSVSPGAAFKTIYTSTWQTDKANDAIPADDFTRRKWSAPTNPTGRFQVLVELRWWYQGAVEGFVRAQYEWYLAKWKTQSYENNEYCLQMF